MSLTIRVFKATGRNLRLGAAIALVSTIALSGCTTGEVFHQGYVVDQTALELTPVGSSREQVLLSLGTPSTTATFDNEVFYYVSQKRTRAAMFMKPKLVDQSVLAVYFDEEGTVKQIANYTLQDGRVFDMISRTQCASTASSSKRHDVGDLDHRVHGRAGGVLVRIADGITGDGSLVGFEPFSCLTPSLSTKPSSKDFLALSQAPPPGSHRDGHEEAVDDHAQKHRTDCGKGLKPCPRSAARRSRTHDRCEAPAAATARSFP
jgi:outer membrane protein assembly factor BamE (lipoprotein component of BamABCDE complex)